MILIFKQCPARFHCLSWNFVNDGLTEEDDWESTIDSIMSDYDLDEEDRKKDYCDM